MDATAIVVSAEVSQGTGILAHEPITTAVLRDERDGTLRTVRIVGGPTAKGFARVAGYVVPVKGMRVALDLKEQPRRSALFPYSTTTWVPSTTPGKWASLPVLFTLSQSSGGPNDALAELDVAARTWSRPLCTAFRASTSPTPQSITPGDDGINGVFFHDDWPAGLNLEPGALGQTVTHADTSGNYRDTDIHINTKDFQFAVTAQDLRGVFVHEIGHALGLGHSNDARATMNASGSGLRWRSLEKDDVEGVCALYPGSKPALTNCDPVCPANFICVGGVCQKKGEPKDLCSPCPVGDLGSNCEASGDDARCVDLPNSGGRVCGRGCAQDADCGDGFRCRPTTEAGDRQCLSDCRNGANTCTADAECKHFDGAACRNGVCAGPPTTSLADAGGADAAHAASDAAPPDNISAAGGGDCECRATRAATRSSSRASSIIIIIIAAVFAACYRRRATR